MFFDHDVFILTYVQKNPAGHPDMKEIIDDASALLRVCSHAVHLSALHTYISALVLTPKASKLYKTYISSIADLPAITSSHALWTTSLRTLEGHTSGVNSVVFSPDGSKLASASGDQTVRLWGVETGTTSLRTLEGHTLEVISVVFSPDGTKLASASHDNTVHLWDAETGNLIGTKEYCEFQRCSLFLFFHVSFF